MLSGKMMAAYFEYHTKRVWARCVRIKLRDTYTDRRALEIKILIFYSLT
jgi:hypothetical protein